MTGGTIIGAWFLIDKTLINNFPKLSVALDEGIYRCENISGVTILLTKNSNIEKYISLIEWKQEKYFESEESAKAVCNRSNVLFNKYSLSSKKENTYFSTGKINKQKVVCLVEGKNTSCSSENALFPLKATESYDEGLKKLTDLSSFSMTIVR